MRGQACNSGQAILPKFGLQGVLTCFEASSTQYYDLGLWLRAALLTYRRAHLSGLYSLQGKDRMIAEVLKYFEGIGLLDAYMVKVDRSDSYKLCVGDAFQYDLEGIHCRETTVGHWTTLDGSKSGFADNENRDFDAIDERIMQVSTSHVW